ncbi:MAG TPA: pyridoxamine 5'-phosphate oxidase, partial [Acidimicrobiales bacterium]|nr:pyridoxamine 5'-phosphate oxidase [Acidimicrobiales bacterium]
MDLADLDPDPITQFCRWKEELAPQEDACCLATASADGVPNARMVLVKGAAETGFVFHTNRDSIKGRELAENPRATLVFHWDPRSVRVCGTVEPVTAAESDSYWAARPRGSQLGAWASAQSTVIRDRSVLEARLASVAARFEEGSVVPRPPYWGGFRVLPEWIEFWHHRDDRLHDRVRYRFQDGSWVR